MTTVPAPADRPRSGWTLAIVSIALFMTALDNLVVGVALPSIRVDLGESIESLQWTVNAYTLTFAVLLIPGAALGDRFGRKRMFVIGLGIFTLASALAALAPSIEALITLRALQGLGAAIVLPLTLTLLSEAVAVDKRGMALGVWAGVSGLGVALGPFVGGAVVEGIAWQWIFWLNVPVGLVLLPLAARLLTESHGPSKRLDLPGLVLAGTGLFGLTFGIVRATALGWTSTTVLISIGGGLVLVAAFLWWQTRSPAPMLPLRFSGHGRSLPPTASRSRCSSASSARSSCSRSSSRPPRATRPSRPGCGRCPGPPCRCLSRRSPASSAIGSDRDR
jgi:MFS family permease